MEDKFWTASTVPNPGTAAGVSIESMLDIKRRFDEHLKSQPTAFVMTKATFDELVAKATPRGVEIQVYDRSGAIFGMPIETYDTIRECLDRMNDQRTGERLVLAYDSIPADCLDHPWVIENRFSLSIPWQLRSDVDMYLDFERQMQNAIESSWFGTRLWVSESASKDVATYQPGLVKYPPKDVDG